MKNDNTTANNITWVGSKKYFLLNEIFSAITHGIGVLLAIAGAICLIVHGSFEGGAMRITTFSIYGGILILFYLASTLFHSLYFTGAEKLFQIFDHSAIYLLIAGTYTPYCLVAIQGWLGWTIFGIIWAVTIMGIVYKSIWMGKYKTLSTVMYVVMGWMCLLGIVRLYQYLGVTGFFLLLFGGIAFTLGAVIYSFKQIPFGHVIWHLFVLLGTIMMYFSIYLYV
ncbi:hemolysin III family protein [Apilactobacillus micheneri]|uniref:Hemolysin III family protein n=1 Tax=Apilactobacillus micheneri TaxID=1899430 RepID=A0ABY2YWD4_9LACO|nr:hemolysin III family protein [Apilactobacillus micheneri]TPR24552.1 hemolysin III family protein [Apilactobacillus micheneri]TPR25863.1 hemolysin III family protein [Apilactobacillus micheneri]TPR28053.1 hemolysin III family protein [Apilactobacillus micheneri]TPR29544.1 hemolysin III family protein [Apilactobacillus micheneri]TPR30330.1 hemolysin III family protein [Apilactobacillus micheneri]